MKQRYWSALSDSQKKELKDLWQNSSDVYQDNYDGFSAWLLNNYNIIIDNENYIKKDNKMIIFIGIIIVLVCIIAGIVFANGSDISISHNKAYCETDYILKNGQCEKLEAIMPNQTINYYCLYDMKLVGNQCIQEQYSDAIVDYSCSRPYSYRFGLNACYYSFRGDCPLGYSEYVGSCIPEKVPASVKYKCYSGKLVGNQCVQEYSSPAIPEYVYSCPSGYTLEDNNICTKIIIKDVKYR